MQKYAKICSLCPVYILHIYAKYAPGTLLMGSRCPACPAALAPGSELQGPPLAARGRCRGPAALATRTSAASARTVLRTPSLPAALSLSVGRCGPGRSAAGRTASAAQ